MKLSVFHLSLLMLLFLSSCKTIEVLPPDKSTLQVPVKNPVISTLNIPIEFDLTNQLKQVENSLPMSFDGKEDHCEGVSFSYKFYRDPIDFLFRGQELNYFVDGKFSLKLNYCPKCHELWDGGSCTVPRVYASCGLDGEGMRRVKVAYTTKINIQNNFQFKSSTDLKKFDILDPCKITVFKYDATAEVEKQVTEQLKKLEKDIDKQIQSIDLKSQMDDVWKQLQTPLDLAGYGFLYLNPNAIAMTQPQFKNKTVYLNLSMKLAPVVQTEKTEIKPTKLPNLSEYKRGSGFDLSVDVRASYDSLSSIANAQMAGKEIDIKNKKIIVKKLRIDGTQDNKMLFEMQFEGAKKGTVYLTGVPQIDSVTQILTMTDLAFDVKTKSVLLKSAKWLFNDKILEMLKKYAVFDLKPVLSDAKKQVTTELNRDLTKEVHLQGNLSEMRINRLFLVDNALLLRTQFIGELKLKMK